jgi:hypothetical protein
MAALTPFEKDQEFTQEVTDDKKVDSKSKLPVKEEKMKGGNK